MTRIFLTWPKLVFLFGFHKWQCKNDKTTNQNRQSPHCWSVDLFNCTFKTFLFEIRKTKAHFILRFQAHQCDQIGLFLDLEHGFLALFKAIWCLLQSSCLATAWNWMNIWGLTGRVIQYGDLLSKSLRKTNGFHWYYGTRHCWMLQKSGTKTFRACKVQTYKTICIHVFLRPRAKIDQFWLNF